MPTYLKNIDWDDHDGVNLPMINDVLRNRFYEEIIKEYVRNQECIDIGFGTGLLSMIAIKHGAKHIIAYESDDNRFHLGCEVIDRLKLQDKITLVNKRYSPNDPGANVIFTETMSAGIWGEGLWNNLPRTTNQIFLPGEYFLEIWATTISASAAHGLLSNKENHRYFNPGIDVDPAFASTINDIISEQSVFNRIFNKKFATNNPELPTGIVNFNCHKESVFGWKAAQKLTQHGQIVSEYRATMHLDGLTKLQLEIPVNNWHDQIVLIVPRAGARHGNKTLYLDESCWGPSGEYFLLVNNKKDLTITHNLTTGFLEYSLKE